MPREKVGNTLEGRGPRAGAPTRAREPGDCTPWPAVCGIMLGSSPALSQPPGAWLCGVPGDFVPSFLSSCLALFGDLISQPKASGFRVGSETVLSGVLYANPDFVGIWIVNVD